MGLNKKQTDFVREYLISGNGEASAKKAGYSDKTARSQSYKFLENLGIQAAIKKGQDKLAEEAEYTKQQHIKDLQRRKSLYNQMLGLAAKGDRTDTEEALYRDLKSVMRGSDITRLDDQIAKMLGFYTPEQLEVKGTWTVDFGGEPGVDDNEDQVEE